MTVSSRECCCFLHQLTFCRQLSGQNVDADGSIEPILAYASFLRMLSLPLMHVTAFFPPYSAIFRLPSAIDCSQLSIIEDCPSNFTPYSLPCLIYHIGMNDGSLCFPSLSNLSVPTRFTKPFPRHVSFVRVLVGLKPNLFLSSSPPLLPCFVIVPIPSCQSR